MHESLLSDLRYVSLENIPLPEKFNALNSQPTRVQFRKRALYPVCVGRVNHFMCNVCSVANMIASFKKILVHIQIKV